MVQIDAFSAALKEHQKAITPDGTTVLAKAMIEHNLQAASRLYNNMYFTELAQLLSVSPEKGEQIAARMIAENRLAVSPSVHCPIHVQELFKLPYLTAPAWCFSIFLSYRFISALDNCSKERKLFPYSFTTEFVVSSAHQPVVPVYL